MEKTKTLGIVAIMGAFILSAGIAALPSYQTPIPVDASSEIPCSPVVDNPNDPDTVIQRCSDEDVILDKETGEERGSTHAILGDNIVCMKVDKEKFPGTTIDDHCTNVGP
jgi:hypothetical protein